MVVLYLGLIALLWSIGLLVRWRAAALEKRYERVAADADRLLYQARLRPGNGRLDPLATARQQFDLAVMALRRDGVERRYAAWQSLADRLVRVRRGLAGYRGKALPYLGGLLDVALAVVALDRFGPGLTQVRGLLGL